MYKNRGDQILWSIFETESLDAMKHHWYTAYAAYYVLQFITESWALLREFGRTIGWDWDTRLPRRKYGRELSCVQV